MANNYKRTREAVRYFELAPRNRAQRPTAPRIVQWVKIALSTSSISAGASGTPGTGTATLQVFDGSSFASTGIAITVFNLADKVIANGSYIKVCLVDGYWWVDLAQCSRLS